MNEKKNKIKWLGNPGVYAVLEANFLLISGTVLPPCCLTCSQTIVDVMKVMGTSFKRSHSHTAAFCALDPANQATAQARPLPTQASASDSWTLMGKSWSVSCGVTAFFSWVLVYKRFCLCPPRVCVSSPV